MEKITVNTKEQLDELEKDSALTLEGLNPSDEEIACFLNWIKRYTELKVERVYIVSGSLMNMAYGLTGTNAYPEKECDLVAVKLSDMKDPMKLCIPRFQIGGRWFDDIVDNNKRREDEKREVND